MQDERRSQFYNLGKGALKKWYDPNGLIVKMCTKYFCNSTNKLTDEDIDMLIHCPKVKVENFKRKSKLMNLSMEFNRVNKNSKVYFSSNIEYYASVIDGKVHLFAVTYTKRQGVNSIALTYLPEGNVDESIFLARVCYHPDEHRNKADSTIIPSRTVHLHKASEKYYAVVDEREKDKPDITIAKHYAHPDAVALDTKESVNVVGKRLFKLSHRTIDMYQGKDMIDYMKKNINKEIERGKK